METAHPAARPFVLVDVADAVVALALQDDLVQQFGQLWIRIVPIAAWHTYRP
jgi:hypothetical protein